MHSMKKWDDSNAVSWWWYAGGNASVSTSTVVQLALLFFRPLVVNVYVCDFLTWALFR
jgi:hypothetical protein